MTGAEIREARLKKGLTQQELAVKIGVSLNSVNNWEREKCKPQRFLEEVIRKILK